MLRAVYMNGKIAMEMGRTLETKKDFFPNEGGMERSEVFAFLFF